MEELENKNEVIIKEEKKPNFMKRFCHKICENKELIVQVGVAILGAAGAIMGLVGIKEDHKLTREEQKFDQCQVFDKNDYMDYYAKVPLTNEDRKDIVDRERNGESVYEILKDMGKI